MYNQASRLQTYILVSLVSELKKSHIDDVFQQREGDIRCRSASNQGQVRFRKLCDLLVTDGDAPPRACGFCTSPSPSLPPPSSAMAQWGQGQPGYQYPMQTGFQPANPQYQQNPQFQQPNLQFQQNPQFQPGYGQPGSGILPQRTGYLVNQGMQPQQTGFPGNGVMQAQPTGYPGPGSNFSSALRPAPPPPVPPIPAQYQQNQGNFLQPQQQPQQSRGFLSPSPGLGGPGLSAIQPQQTGYPAARPLVPQVTGYMDPRLQMMSSTFLPMNPSTPYSAGGAPQLPSQLLPGGLSLQQSFQQHNQEVKGTAAPRVPWALSKQEKKNYDNIFRAWDTHGDGFISGQTALDVFGQSDLSKDDLARIW